MNGNSSVPIMTMRGHNGDGECQIFLLWEGGT